MVATKRASVLLAVLTVIFPPLVAHGAELRGLINFAGRNVKWGDPVYGSRAEVTYAFLHQARSFPGARNCAEMLPIAALSEPAAISDLSLRTAVRQATHLWSNVASIAFREIDDSSKADILIGAQNGKRGVAFTNVSRDDLSGPVEPLTQAAICLDPSEQWSAAFDGDLDTYDLQRVIAHEIGHAIGLDHQGRDGGMMGFAYIEHPALELSTADITAATLLYGPADSARQTASTHDADVDQDHSIKLTACAAVSSATVECGLAKPGGSTSPAAAHISVDR